MNEKTVDFESEITRRILEIPIGDQNEFLVRIVKNVFNERETRIENLKTDIESHMKFLDDLKKDLGIT